MTPEQIAAQLDGRVQGPFGMFSSDLSAQEFKRRMDDAGFQTDEAREHRGEFLVPFIPGDMDSACPICGGEVYFDFSSWKWGHALRSQVPYYSFSDEEAVVADSRWFVSMIEEFLSAYYKTPDGYHWTEVRDHNGGQSCEICARIEYGCLR